MNLIASSQHEEGKHKGSVCASDTAFIVSKTLGAQIMQSHCDILRHEEKQLGED